MRINTNPKRRIYTEALDKDAVLLTPKQLATRWQVHPGSLANARSRGEGAPFIRVGGGRVRYPLRAVQEFELGIDTPAAA